MAAYLSSGNPRTIIPSIRTFNRDCVYQKTPPNAQINFAGEGGLYAEMIQDRSFDAMAYALGFPPANATVPLRATDSSDAASSRRQIGAEGW